MDGRSVAAYGDRLTMVHRDPARRLHLSTFAPTVMAGPRLHGQAAPSAPPFAGLEGPTLSSRVLDPVLRAEALGLDAVLIAQRWWGTAAEIEGSSLDCLAMTSWYAALTERIGLITAIHPGFFLPAAIAKWGATVDRLSGGRWSVNVTTGWHLREFAMFGAEAPAHDLRYERSAEFLDILRGAWECEEISYSGHWYSVDGLRVEPRPVSERLTVYQGGQSEAARSLAAAHSDWMFLNGGPPEKIAAIVADVKARAAANGRKLRCLVYAIPLCRPTDAEAEADISRMLAAADPVMADRRRTATSGAQGMWEESADPLTRLDSNEGYASRLIGSPATVLRRAHELIDAGVDGFHVLLNDRLFVEEVLPSLREIS